MRSIALGGFVVTAALVAGCSSAGPKALPAIPPVPASGAASGQPASGPPTSAAPTGASATGASATGSPTGSATPTGPPTSSANLVVDDDVRAGLLAAFRATKVAPTSVFTGPDAGSVYYAYLAPTKTYWALARFSLGAGSTTRQQVSMQDAGSGGLFSRAAGQPWKLVGDDGGGGPFPCPGELDPELLTLWHLSVEQNCEAASGRAARANGDVTFVNGPGSDAPSGTYRGLIDLQEVSLASAGEIWLDAETVTADGSVTNTKPLRILQINVTEATRTEYSVGSDAASSHVVEGGYDAAFGKRVTADFSSSDASFVVTVSGGAATLIQEVSAITPTGGTTYGEP